MITTVVLFISQKRGTQMLNFHIRKVLLKNGDTRYRTIITQ